MSYPQLIQSLFSNNDHHVDVLRLDIIDKEISGNKWFKLKYNLNKVVNDKSKQLITFGGAYSNHLAATAAACKRYEIPCIGIIRGDKETTLNSTLQKAKEDGMKLHFVSRDQYSRKTEPEFSTYLTQTFGEHFLIPEGGNNEYGIKGCEEIIDPSWDYDYILCACGTGATYSGIVATTNSSQKVIGISVLKGINTLVDEVNKNLHLYYAHLKKQVAGNEAIEKKEITDNCVSNLYAFSGYAKHDHELIKFKEQFEMQYKIPLDYIYTNKVFYAAFDLIRANKFKKKSSVLILHCGGLQGNDGFESRYHLMPTR